MRLLQLVDPVQHGADPIDRRVRVAADLKPHERRVPVGGDLTRVRRSERGADVLDDVERRDRRDDVATAALNNGSLARSVELCIRTFSPAGCGNPASRILSMRPDSPGPGASASIVFMPTMPPIPNATTTNASQPNVAVFQWVALQRPMRAAMLRFECVVRDMPSSFVFELRGGRAR